MMKKLAFLTAVSAVVLSFAASPVLAASQKTPNGKNLKGTQFESPFVVDGGDEVPGSEGKVDDFGNYKVEIPLDEPATEDVTYSLCFKASEQAEVFLQNIDVFMGDDEVFAENEDAEALEGMTFQAPSFVVRAGGDDCNGDALWESGFTTAAD